jgi:hypothetical protein
MSKYTKLHEAFDRLISGDEQAADELLHTWTVERAKEIYQEINESEMYEFVDDMDDVSVSGDETEDFIDDVSSDADDVENDEINAGEVEMDDMDTDEMQSDEIADISAKLDELMSKFNQLLDAEAEEESHDPEEIEDLKVDDESDESDDFEDDSYDEDDSDDLEYVKEGYETVSADLSKEGQLAGTGKNSKTGAVQTKSPLSSAPEKSMGGKGQPVKFGGGDEKGTKANAATKVPAANEKLSYKNVSSDVGTAEGKYAGTGKNTPGAGSVQKNSLLTKPLK